MENNITCNGNEIIMILNTIKNICSYNNECNTCPFYISNRYCGIQTVPPHAWKIKDIEKSKQFKAFKE